MRGIFLIITLFFALSFAGEGPVSYYGKLKVREGAAFLDGEKKGSEVQLRGVSFGWSNTSWESGRFYQAEFAATAVEHMVKDWKAEVVRAAYGTTSSAFTSSTATENRASVERVVDAAIANDVYVIIDFHSHNAQNEVENSKVFFEYMAQKYGDKDNVIFELYNEPINPATWADIKTYSEQIIPVIRKYSTNLILVGTPNYSQKVTAVVGNAIDDGNVGYVLHFYANTHPLNNWRDNIEIALNNGLLIFVTEYGTTDADGGQSNAGHYDTHNAGRTNAWHNFMDEKKISSAAWEVNDKYAGSAFFGIQGAAKKFDMVSWADTTKMNESGKYIFNKLNEYEKTAAWKQPDEPTKLSVNFLHSGEASIEIYSLQGKKAGNSLSNLKAGAYILLLKQGSQTKSVKIVKK